jgi:hypothetical protein
MKARIKRIIGALLLSVGVVVFVVAVLAMLDPVGTQLANDGNPFGDTTDTWMTSVTLAVTALVMMVGGGLLIFVGPHRDKLPADVHDAG